MLAGAVCDVQGDGASLSPSVVRPAETLIPLPEGCRVAVMTLLDLPSE